jgi:hypothetical protein
MMRLERELPNEAETARKLPYSAAFFAALTAILQ